MTRSVKYISKYMQSDLVRGFGLSTFWGGLSKLIMFGVTFYCSNVLTQNGFGEYSFVKNTLDMIILVCANNFSSLGVKFAAESMISIESLKKLYILIVFVMIISTICGIACLVIPYSVIHSFTEGESVAYFIKLIGLFLPIFIIHPFICAILRGFRQFNLVGKYEVVLSVIYLLFIIVGINLGGYKGAIYALFAYYFLFSILGVIVLFLYNKGVHYLIRVDELASQYSCVNKIILPLFLMSFIEAPLAWFAQAEVARRGTYAMIGSLSVILTIRYVLQILPTYFYQAFTPFISSLNMKKQYKEYFIKIDKVIKMLGIVSLFLIPILLVSGKFVLSLFNEVYVSSYHSFVIAVFVIPLILYSVLLNLNMMVREHQRSMFYMSICSSVTFIVFLYVFIGRGINILDSFFLAQAVQYLTRLFFSVSIYLKDKNKCLNLF